MVRMSKPFILLLLLSSFSVIVQAQQANYVVFFTDKDNSSYNINQPHTFLSTRSIDRRNRQQIAITSEDLPVNTTYTQGLETIGSVSVRQTTKWFNAALVQATSGEAESLKLLSYVSGVEFIAPGNVGGRVEKSLALDSLNAIDSDTLFQYDILDIGEMRADGYQGEDMVIAVIDGGFEGLQTVAAFSNLFIGNRLLMSYDFLTRSSNVYQYTDHGTKVMSVMGAEQSNPDYAGVVPNASFLLFVTEDILNEYRLEEYRWLVAAEKADSAGADVITSSLGYNFFDDASMNYGKSDLDGLTAVITRAAQRAAEKGIFVVVSGGNTGLTDPWETVLFPGDIIDGLAVGSISSNFSLSAFSPRGPIADGRIKPDVLAYGSGTYVINKFGNIVNSSGTSFAAPQVAGLAAGVWQAFPEIGVSELLNAFRSSSSNANRPDNEMGYGVPSYLALSNYLSAAEEESWFAAFPNPVIGSDYLHIKVFDPIIDTNVQLDLFDTLGKPILDEQLNISWQFNEYFLDMKTLPQGIYILNLQSTSNFSQIKILKL